MNAIAPTISAMPITPPTTPPAMAAVWLGEGIGVGLGLGLGVAEGLLEGNDEGLEETVVDGPGAGVVPVADAADEAAEIDMAEEAGGRLAMKMPVFAPHSKVVHGYVPA